MPARIPERRVRSNGTRAAFARHDEKNSSRGDRDRRGRVRRRAADAARRCNAACSGPVAGAEAREPRRVPSANADPARRVEARRRVGHAARGHAGAAAERTDRSRRRAAPGAAALAHLQVRVLPDAFVRHAGTAGGTPNAVAPHCPLGERAASRTNVSVTGAAFPALQYAPCDPETTKSTAPGCEALIFTVTFVIPAAPPSLFWYVHRVSEGFDFHPVRVPKS